jgi:hypothetical protein
VTVKPLLIIFHARDIPMFLDAVSKLKMDKLWVNYYAQLAAYPLARIEFLKREEYTHFVILADDLIVRQRDLDILTNECERFDSISGWCNLWHTGPYSELSNVSFKLPPNPPAGHTIEEYYFIKMSVLEIMKVANEPMPAKNNILAVEHQGTALTFLSRKVLEMVQLRTDLGCCPDSLLSHDLNDLGIPQYIDLRVKMLHLKTSDSFWLGDNPSDPIRNLLIDIKPPSVVFEPQ